MPDTVTPVDDPLSPGGPYRLPRTVVPARYTLELTPDLAGATFGGHVAIDLDVREAATEIVLNAVELRIDDAALVAADGTRTPAVATLDAGAERATLSLTEPASPGRATLEIAFRGILNDQLAGFYRSTFTDADGAERVIAATQFESTDARRAFPCFDEPDLKATFAVTLVVADDLLAVSNGAVVEETPRGDGLRAVRFSETMVMSTYLVCFVVGPLVATDPVDVDGTPVRVIAVPGKLALAPYALELAAHSLRFFERYYDIRYPARKLDLIAIPDFAFGAMENLGAIVFRETALLADPETAPTGTLQSVAHVVAHEIAHMWFGDLVTMRWWNGLWLNEAFATFMENICVDAFRPEWRTWSDFGAGAAAAMLVDGLGSTRPIEFPVHAPSDADGMFDVLTYQKGGAVLRMLERYLGPEAFRRGVSAYLSTHAYANTETTDLFDAIEASLGDARIPVRRIMDGWIFRGGYPLVTVAPDEDGGGAVATQARFRYLPDEAEPAEAGGDQTWFVPMLIRGDDDAHGGGDGPRRVLLGPEPAPLGHAHRGQLVANAGAYGFYRVRYDPALRPDPARLTPDERHGLVGDAWAATVSGAAPATEFVALARQFAAEADRTVWDAVLGGLRGLDRILDGDARARLQAIVRELLAPSAARLGWAPASADEDGRTRQLRATVLGALGVLGADPQTQATAAEHFAAFRADPRSVDPDVLPVVVGVVAHGGGRADYEAFDEIRLRAATPQQEQLFRFGLSAFTDPALADRTLADALSGRFRTQDAPYLILRLLAGRESGPAAWRFVTEHWDAILDRFPDNSLPRMLEGISLLTDDASAEQVPAFLAAHPLPLGLKTVDQHLERQRVNRALRRRESARLSAALLAED